MSLVFFVKGILLGFAIAAPIGPVGVLCVRRALHYGRVSGFVSGLGAAAADTFYGCFAAFSVTLISDFVFNQHCWFRLIGGGFLMFLGGKTFFAPGKPDVRFRVSHRSLVSDFLSTFLLTVSNPLTPFSFIAIFAALGLVDISESYTHATFLVLGIFAGSCAWWALLTECVGFFRKKMGEMTMTWINRAAGMIVVAFGILAFLSLLHCDLDI